MSGVDHIHALTGQYSCRCFPSRSDLEIHLSGERWVAPETSPDYSWTGVWRMGGIDHTRTQTREYSYRCFPSWSGVEIHMSGERWVSPNAQVELAFRASVCGNLNNQG